MNRQVWPHLPSCTAPTGLQGVPGAAFPALKRWANEHRAYGANRLGVTARGPAVGIGWNVSSISKSDMEGSGVMGLSVAAS